MLNQMKIGLLGNCKNLAELLQQQKMEMLKRLE